MATRSKTKVAIYSRAATIESVDAQMEFYKRKYSHTEDSELVGLYIDIGVSANNEKRQKLQQLLAECKTGKIDEVHIRSVSRLAREPRMLVKMLNKFKECGVRVIFEQEGELSANLIECYAKTLSDHENYIERRE